MKILCAAAALSVSASACIVAPESADTTSPAADESALDGSSSTPRSGYRVTSFGDKGVLPERTPEDFSNTLPALSIGDGEGGTFAVVDVPGVDGWPEPTIQHRFADGSADKTFGLTGKVRLDQFIFSNGSADKAPIRLLADTDGMFLAVDAGMWTGQTQIARFTHDGKPDSSFGTDGYVQEQFGGYGNHQDGLVTVLSLGREGYLVVGRQTRSRGACSYGSYFARLDRSGQRANRWAGDGLAVHVFVQSDEATGARIVDGDKVEIQVQAIGRTSNCRGSKAGPDNDSSLAQIWL